MSPLNLATDIQPRIPSSFELAELIDKVVSDWAFFSADPSGKPVAGPAPLSLEYSVRLKGPVDCVLVLRADSAFGAELAHASTGDPNAREQGADAFKELCNLVASHVLTAFLGGTTYSFDPFVPQATRPDQWPSAPADAESVMLVDRFMLEARLWIGTHV